MPSYFIRSLLTNPCMTTTPTMSSVVRPVLDSSQVDRGTATVLPTERSAVLTESHVGSEIPLDLTVCTSRGLGSVLASLSELTSTWPTVAASSAGRSNTTAESARNISSNTVCHSGAVLSVNSSCAPSIVNISRSSQLCQAGSNDVQFLKTSVTVPADDDDDLKVGRDMQDEGLTYESTRTSTDTKPVMIDTAVSQLHETVTAVIEQCSTSTGLSVSHGDTCHFLSPDVKPDLLTAVTDQDISNTREMPMLVPKVEQECLQPLSTNDVPQPCDFSHLSPCPLTVATAVSLSSTVRIHSPTFSPSVETVVESCDILPPSCETVEANVIVCKTAVDADSLVEQQVLSSTDQLQSAATQQTIGSSATDKVTEENLVLDSIAQNDALFGHSTTSHTTIKVEQADENVEHSSLSLELSVEVPSKDLGSVIVEHNTSSERGSDHKQVSDRTEHDAVSVACKNEDDQRAWNILDAGNKTADTTDNISAALVAITANTTASNERVSESKPIGIASEPDSASVAMEPSAPAANTLQPNTANVHTETNPDNTVRSAANTISDKDQRFKELMIKCTKALELCLTRFPQHYKSLYRLADVFFRCSCLKVSFVQHVRPKHDNFLTMIYLRYIVYIFRVLALSVVI